MTAWWRPAVAPGSTRRPLLPLPPPPLQVLAATPTRRLLPGHPALAPCQRHLICPFPTPPHLRQGVGPATASAILQAADPSVPFTSDEAMLAALGSRDYKGGPSVEASGWPSQLGCGWAAGSAPGRAGALLLCWRWRYAGALLRTSLAPALASPA